MDIENFIAEFKKTFVYDMLSMSLKDEQLFEHVVDDDGVLWFKEQTRQMWSMWQAAKAKAVPEGFVLVPISLLKDINSIAVNEFHKWKIIEQTMPEICEYMQDLSYYIGIQK